ncbi:non-ribosomal peptide synthetase [Vibrio caribbeanicus]|uniref:Non-ribosomal peptide synthetase n=1 Tax=Vibrio caribbeanicus ATCC BAA-2122 TaxID=796620 RepID=E3BMD7_9VIBR|nr:non-ribosomal peptide synthetase [Vibrio caribbeanicus]EFP95682.1 non-ribosomal peptide synthetase [Vibrio caribbeanicus ATCC BAA-2122]
MSKRETNNTLVQLFEVQATLTPDNTALIYNDKRLSYSELNKLSDNIADHILKVKSRNSGGFIGVMLEKSPHMIASLIGIMKANYAYVPIDPCYPSSRVKHIISDAELDLVLTTEDLMKTSSLNSDIACLVEDVDFNYKKVQLPTVKSSDLSYMIYTSGTTGHPKGVMVEHRNIVNTLKWRKEYYNLSEIDTHLQFASYAFDTSLEDIFSSLISGGKLVLQNSSEQFSKQSILNLISKYSITHVLFTPSYYQILLGNLASSFDSVRSVTLAGEPLTLDLVKSHFELTNNCELYNEYGPTEGAVCSSVKKCSLESNEVSIGDAISNVEIILLNDELKPVEGDDIGEICISGAGLARGYWRNKSLTEEKFITIDTEKSLRIYRTGDYGKRSGDRDLIFLGRRDDQIKINGIRVELEEIKKTITAVSLVKRAEVIIQKESKQILAFLITEKEFILSEFNDKLKEILPKHLQPSLTFVVDSIPLTVNGKVDKDKLLLISKNSEDTFEERDKKQEIQPDVVSWLCQRFDDILERKDVGINDNFFSLGGNSLKAIQMCFEISSKYDFQIDYNEIYRASTPQELAKYIGNELSCIETIDKNMSDMESWLCQQFEKILGRTNVDREDNFFALGGSSLKAIELCFKISSKYNFEIDLNDIYQVPTPKGLASYILPDSLDIGKDDKEETEQGFPLSYNQKQIWISHQLAPMQDIYHCPIELNISGQINKEILQRAFLKLIERHDILRVSFVEIDGEPRQIIKEDLEFNIDFQSNTKFYGLNVTNSVDKSEVNNGFFDLSKPPLIRASLIEEGKKSYLLKLVLHHIIFDGFSIGNLINELFIIYSSLSTQKSCDLAELSLQYPEYSKRLIEQESSKSFIESEKFWKEKLSNESHKLELPYLKSPDKTETELYSSHYNYHLSVQLTNTLREQARVQETSVYTLLVGFLNILLHRYTGQNDIVLATVAHGRSRHDLKDLIGPFSNTVLLSTKVNHEQKISDVIESTKSEIYDSFKNQRYPYYYLQKNIAKSSDTLFNVLVEYQDFDYQIKIGSGESEIDISYINHVPTNRNSLVDLNIIFFERNGQLNIQIKYCSSKFENFQIENLCGHFENIVKVAMSDLDKTICSFPIILEKELEIIDKYNDTAVGLTNHSNFIDCFIETSKKYPNEIAVEDENDSITYLELEEKSNQFAQFLLSLSINHQSVISVILERSVNWAVSILGIWKAGMIYLPLDPSLPQDRMATMIKKSQSVLVISELTHEPLSEQIIARAKCIKHTLYIDETDAEKGPGRYCSSDIDNQPKLLKEHHSFDEDVAFICFTSGSTGQPKGAMIEHLGMLNHMVAKVVDLGMTSEEVIVQDASQSFDISIWQLFTAHIVGGKSSIFSKGTMLDLPKLIERLNEREVSILEMSPSFLTIFLDYLDTLNSRCHLPLRYLAMGGETLQPNAVARWLEYFPTITMLNAYGATEASDGFTHYFITSPVSELTTPIGNPIQNFKMYITDANMNLCPIGIKGEICAAGIGVGRGYIYDLEKTSAAFIDNPFVDGQERLYRTGDLGRYNPKGYFDFFGRKDNQIKIRGHRIELGEIESQLCSLEQINHSVVIATEKKSGELTLCAYVCSVDNKKLDISSVEINLAQKLPEAMIPEYIIQIEEIPLNENDKVDKKRLPKPEDKSAVTEYHAPRAESDIRLKEIWSSLLNNSEISIKDDFFRIGGHSLTAVMLISRVRKELSIEITLAELFKYRTIESLSNYIKDKSKSNLEPIRNIPHESYYPCTPLQLGIWAASEINKNAYAYNVPMVFKLEGKIDEKAVSLAYFTVIERHESLRTQFINTKEGLKQSVLDPDSLPLVNSFRSYDSIGQSDDMELLNKVIESESKYCFDLGSDSLSRLSYIRCDNSISYLVFNFHHIIFDGWSSDIFINEFYSAYKDNLMGRISSLSPLDIQHKDFSIWYNEAVESNKMLNSKKYWASQFYNGPSPKPTLPYDYSNSVHTGEGGDRLNIRFEKEASRKFLSLIKDHNTTAYVGVLSLIYSLYYYYGGVTDITIGSSYALRDHPQLEGQIGNFVNSLPLRLIKFSPESNFCEIIEQVNELVMEALEHKAYPFVEILGVIPKSYSENLYNTYVDFNTDSTATFEDVQLLKDDLVSLSSVATKYFSSKYELSFDFAADSEGLTCSIEFDRTKFSKLTIETMQARLQKLIDIIVTKPSVLLRDIDLSLVEIEVDNMSNLVELF